MQALTLQHPLLAAKRLLIYSDQTEQLCDAETRLCVGLARKIPHALACKALTAKGG